MKNRKWLNYTLGILFSLIALAAVGMAGFRVGMMQNVPFGRMAFDHNFGNNGPMMQGVNPTDGTNNTTPNNSNNFGNNPKFMQGNMRGQEFNHRGFDRRGGMSVFGGLFGLIHFAILALLLWFGYKLVKNSGWKLVRVQNAPAAAESASAEVEEKKE